jgi:hypothetical protein
MSRYYHKDRTKKLKKEARTRPIGGHIDYGDGEDHGKYYRCWNCDMVCNVERDALGGIDDRPDINVQPYNMISQDASTPLKSYTGDVGSSLDFTVGDDGDGRGIGYTTQRYTSDIASGCPFCGTKNWRGDHP